MRIASAPRRPCAVAVEWSRRRAMETIGAVAAFRDGKVVWERADGTFI